MSHQACSESDEPQCIQDKPMHLYSQPAQEKSCMHCYVLNKAQTV